MYIVQIEIIEKYKEIIPFFPLKFHSPEATWFYLSMSRFCLQIPQMSLYLHVHTHRYTQS